jgi:deoxyribodipyrimidine photolyase-related protein
MRHLILVLGDQLAPDNPAFAGFDPRRDRVLMIESAAEGRVVWSHKARIVLFLSAMRHFRDDLLARGFEVEYITLADSADLSLGSLLVRQVAQSRPQRVIVCEPGEYRVLGELQDACALAGVALEMRADTHFMLAREEFADWAGGRKTLQMETFYRFMRKRTGILMVDGVPEGGVWNLDHENRGAYLRGGPGAIPPPALFEPDLLTRQVIAEVETRFAGHPGSLARFAWPVTRAEALRALAQFVRFRLAGFGRFQDAMWSGTPFGWHALLSTSLNLKLIGPREVIDAALAAFRHQALPLAAVEGFVRQVLGWREFIRGVYWLDMPGLAAANHYGHHRPLPGWYWSAQTRMQCLRETVGQTLEYGFAHHIQRLMVTGNFALLAGLDPAEVHRWYLAVYVDAVEWAELPNTAGMALYANGGRFTTKPYAASGAYIKRMSNYCAGCRYKPELRHGPDACPMTALYWNFLDQNEAELSNNMRASLMVRNLQRLAPQERSAIRAQAAVLLANLEAL